MTRPSVTFWLPFIPSGSKNSRDIVKTRDGRRFPKTNDRVLKQWRAISKIVEAMRQRDRWPDFGDDELAMKLDIDERRQATLVRIYSLGPPPKGRTGRGRDIDNVLSTVFDGLGNKKHQARAIGDDKQFRFATVERWPDGIGGIESRDEDQIQ